MSVFDFIHLLHGARGGESQTNRMCMQVSVSMSVLSVFVLSAFVCLFTAQIVQIIRWHRASSLYYMLDKYQAAILHSKCSSSTCKMINVKTQGWWLSSSSCCGSSYAPWSEGGCLSSALLNAKTAFRWQNQKDRDSRVDCLLETGCFNNNEEVRWRFWKEEKERCLQQRTSGRFTTRTEDLCTVQQKAIVQCPLVGSWGRQNLGQNEACWVAPALSARDSHAALFSLIVVLNRNTLALSTIWSTERGR